MGEIIDTGFLVTLKDNPDTGERLQPVWVPRDRCPAEMIAKWESKNKGDVGHEPHALQMTKRSASSMAESGLDQSMVYNDNKVLKKPKLEGKTTGSKNGSSSRPTYLGFRPFNQKPRPAKPMAQRNLTIDKPVDPPTSHDTVTAPGNTDAAAHWLLDPIMSTKKGMTVVITGSSGGHDDRGWYNGEYEGEQAVILSVFNTGNGSFSSTAQVKMLDPRDGAPSVFTIPVEYLASVRPDLLGQKAIVLQGNCKGKVAVIREEGSVESEWFVSAGNNHFEINGENLVLYSEVADAD
ncbi:hypothetical protein EVJ58_g5865 [Rhodofomes roseus]|uniref:Uncharacterized protein n=1 Tax=Rhodofomes roseus TaxID=34475 RepID=A0A4Y9Y9V9_9APHY|nr:hypothetical protein EVJ58_g5865 [Rhodofomes roseus]